MCLFGIVTGVAEDSLDPGIGRAGVVFGVAGSCEPSKPMLGGGGVGVFLIVIAVAMAAVGWPVNKGGVRQAMAMNFQLVT